FYIVSISFGNNPLNTNILSRPKLTSILPEGWAFFTKKSTDPNVYIYNIENNKLIEIKLKNSLPKFFFGISRVNRLYNVELNNIFTKALGDSTITYRYKAVNKDMLLSMFTSDTLISNTVNLENYLAPDFKNGYYLFVVQHMLPWSLLHKKTTFPSKFDVYKIKLEKHE